MSYILWGQNKGELYMVDTWKLQYNLSLRADLANFILHISFFFFKFIINF